MNVSGYLSSARTLSVAIVLLGYLCWELGTFHFSRDRQFAEYRKIVTVDWIAGKFPSAASLEHARVEKLSVGFGLLTVEVKQDDRRRGVPTQQQPAPTEDEPDEKTDPKRFKISVTGKYGDWTIESFAYDQVARYRERMSDLETRLQIGGGSTHPAKVEKAQTVLYQRRIKVPGIDFVDFRSEAAIWVLPVLVCLGLVIVRSRVRLVLLDEKGGHEEPWLILDARSAVEKLVAALWLAGLLVSGWIASGALAMTLKGTIKASGDIPLLLAFMQFGAVLVIAGISGWASLMTVVDLLFIRKVRQTLNLESVRAGNDPKPGAK